MYFVLLIPSLDVLTDYSLSSCVSTSLPVVARVKVCTVFCAWCGLAICSILCFPTFARCIGWL